MCTEFSKRLSKETAVEVRALLCCSQHCQRSVERGNATKAVPSHTCTRSPPLSTQLIGGSETYAPLCRSCFHLADGVALSTSGLVSPLIAAGSQSPIAVSTSQPRDVVQVTPTVPRGNRALSTSSQQDAPPMGGLDDSRVSDDRSEGTSTTSESGDEDAIAPLAAAIRAASIAAH